MKKNRISIFTLILFLFVFLTSCSHDVESKSLKVYMLATYQNTLMNSFVIKTPNDKIIVIDGGGKTSDGPYIPAVIRSILGLGENDYFEIEAWFITHYHNDHHYELAKVLNEYSDFSNFDIKNIYYSIPPIKDGWTSVNGDDDYDFQDGEYFKQGLMNFCKKKNFVGENVTDTNITFNLFNNSVSKGQSLRIDGVKFQILKTWEQSDKWVNSTSLIMRMTYKQHSILFLADAASDTGNKLMQEYHSSILKSEYVQLAHHGQNGTSKEFYDYIDAINSKRLWSTRISLWNFYDNSKKNGTDKTRSWFNLPADYKEYLSNGYDKTGNDIVTGLYSKFPTDPTKISSWTKEVLEEQLVAKWL